MCYLAEFFSDARSIQSTAGLSNNHHSKHDQLFQELLTIDLRQLGMRFEVPFFIFQGDTDAINPTALAKAYFDELEAPHKEFVLIKQAGHLAAFARPEQFLNELLQRVRLLAIGQSKSAK